MLLPKKVLSEEQRKTMINHVYDIVGFAHDVCRQLPCGLPEYIYQEAFSVTLLKHKVTAHKEWLFHPVFDGKPLQSYMRLDFLVEREKGNIIIETKAIEEISNRERAQLFGYMVGTGFPFGLLINFATYPTPQIERYYFDQKDMTLTAF